MPDPSPPSLLRSPFAWGLEQAERGRIPDALLRLAIRRMCRERLQEIAAGGAAAREERRRRFIAGMAAGPVALVPRAANDQHYEVPPAFFRAVLGRHLKYSCALFERGGETLDQAEEGMLACTAGRAGIEDGMRVLDLGCGWGSLSLYLAERFPRCRIVAVSNSKDQRETILGECQLRGLSNLEVVRADMNQFEPDRPPGGFDRVVSVEMFEHMRNWPELFARVARWLGPDGRFFLHVFCHREAVYPFEDRDRGDWMARHFFTGGMMPSFDLPRRFDRDLRVLRQWRVGGLHYRATADAWLANLDARRDAALHALRKAHGDDAPRWLERWRLFFLAVSELFGFHGGEEWFVSHTLLAPAAVEGGGAPTAGVS